jgi:serine/threonine protein kinase
VAQGLTDEDPRRLGAFEILGRLGEGGQGVVYLGRSASGDPVAIKLLHARLSGDAEARARFLREVSVAQRVARFCTASVLHADLAGNQPYIVSEYVPGPSLRQLVDREGPRRGAALDRLAVSTATALAAIHRAGILHRDFKPANVLMGPEGPVVIDFGIARALDTPGATITGDTLGTPSYLAPEQLSGATVAPAVDVFAWGVTIVFAATGRPAFGADSIPAVINRILNEQPDLTALDDSLRDLVAACLSKDPAGRPSAENVVAHLMGRPVSPPGPDRLDGPVNPHATRAGTRRRRGRAVALPVAAAVTAALLTGGSIALARSVTLSGGSSDASAATGRPANAQRPPSVQPSVDATVAEVTPSPASPSRRASHQARPRTSDSPAPASASPSRRPSTLPPSRTPTRNPTSKPTPKATLTPSASPTRKTTPTPSPTKKPTSTPKPSTPPKANPYTATGVCGSGYRTIDSHALGSATVYLLYSATAGKNCVVTLSKYVVPQKVSMSAVLQVKGGATGGDSGAYTAYAGPVRLAAKNVCVIWGGGYGTTTWKSGWSHCG